MALRYKFVELSTVADDTIEACVNEWVAKGWQFEGIRFVMSDASRRPVMAFVSFTQTQAETDLAEPPVDRTSNPLERLVDND